MIARTKRRLAALLAVALLTLVTTKAAPATPSLEAGFHAPPAAARPWTFWIWINGNVTKEGIRADLESMQRTGLGGAFLFDAAMALPKGPVRYGTEAWLEHIRYALEVADTLGLKLAVMNCAGWATSGGPWIDPERSMKELVWSETEIAEGAGWHSQLATPEARLGFYREVAVLALPATEGARSKISDLAIKSGLKAQFPAIVPVAASEQAGPPASAVLDLTAELRADGSLAQALPAGRWTVLRFGYTTTGRTNHPAAPEGEGLEADKLDAAAIAYHFEHGMGRVVQVAGAHAGHSLAGLLFDSWEAGSQTWTGAMPAEFRARRGYDLGPWLACLAGYVVGSPEESEAFLEDFRRTIGELTAEKNYGTFQQQAHAHSMEVYSESYGGIFDEFKINAFVDEPATEFWSLDEPVSGGWRRELFKGFGTTVSAAHTLGRPVIGAEAYTSRPPKGQWSEQPATLKQLGDAAYAAGVNRFNLHSWVHQPRSDIAPGFTHGRYGSPFGRLNSWWPLAPTWTAYLTRAQFMLQAGHPVADVLVLYPERLQSELRDLSSPEPAGYHSDWLAPWQLPQLAVKDGILTLPAGVSYRLLALPAQWKASLATLQQLARLRTAGATILGPAPSGPVGLIDLQKNISAWCAAVDQLWPRGNAIADTGKPALAAALAAQKIPEDFRIVSSATAAAAIDLRFAHRTTDEAEIYFVTNQTGRELTATLEFRVVGRTPELWDAVSGRIAAAQAWQTTATHTRVSLTLAPADSVFVVFRAPLPKVWPTSIVVAGKALPNAIELSASPVGNYTVKWSDGRETAQVVAPAGESLAVGGPWQVNFPPARGAPASINLPALASLTQQTDPGVRYFSGLATWRTNLRVPATALGAGGRWLLDLGAVHDLAKIEVNGREVATLWRPPFRVDVTDFVKTGDNALAVTVANRWVNRLIGDEQLPADATYGTRGTPEDAGALTEFPAWWSDPAKLRTSGRIAFATWKHYDRKAPLLDSGLIGPVRLIAAPAFSPHR